jgi:uncharacterized membrane protein
VQTRLVNRWHALRATFWFVPTLFAAAAVPLAFGLLGLERELSAAGVSLGFLYGGDAEGARSVLVMLAGSMIGTAGVVFSITIVALSLTSSQYGPRLLRNFLRDPGNQVVLGTFVATFLYCLLVLRSIVTGEPVPVLAMSVATALSVASLGVLIYFFHHSATSIQASSIVAGVARDLEHAIERFCARHGAREDADASEVPPLADDAAAVTAPRSGYLQAVDHGGLVAVARDSGGCIEALHRAGDFVIAGSPLARVAPAARFDERACARVRDAFLIGAQATEEQDLEFSVRQLVEVALRALSPGINDPFTALTCIDWLGVALARLGATGMPERVLRDGERACVITDAPTFAGVADTAFQQIRQSAGAHVAVSIRLLETCAAVAPHLRRRADAETMGAQADRVLESALAASPIEPDRAALAARHAQARRALAAAPGAGGGAGRDQGAARS